MARTTRRRWLKGAIGTVAAASAGLPLLTSAARASTGGAGAGRGIGPGFDWERFLVQRLTMGFTVQDWKLAKQMGYQAYLDWQLDYANIDDSAIEGLLATEMPSLAMTPTQLFQTYARNGTDVVAMYELKAATLLRSIYSPRQLFERAVDFWSNHLSQHHGKVLTMLTTDQRDVIRKSALGSFPQMLIDSAHSASMLCYLDNGYNYATAPNENYAREIMELHSLGVRSGYTETDVKEVARCLTGWSWFEPLTYGEFTYYDINHDQGSKTVLGTYYAPNGRRKDGEELVRLLGARQEASEFIAAKLARHFLAYDPSDALVARLAGIYRTTGGDVKSMVREIFQKSTLTGERVMDRQKLKLPYHFVVSLLRALDVQIQKDVYTQNRGDWVVYALFGLGQVPYERITPDGYPDKIEVWGDSMLPRWQFASDLLAGNIYSTYVEIPRLEKRVGTFTQATATDQIDLLLTGGGMRPGDKAQLRKFIENSPRFDETILRESIALAASSPSFQLY